ncbi:MAG TPA: 2-succinyl-5-enolpyruvyl-6-hydroxy-3-cyclohexene-1-carboxylic-acid synthase [Actinomycetota bacterium]|nr:2-succinyl-5-enolpyruvyl-6-hydroxy-3-cyclohexene-1-carboxylic-acid synthase [Actinomycetota bacterium]
MSGHAEISLACASLLADELARGGVEHVCVSPGARSTPLALAVARHPRLRVHVILDERSAAFFGLGIAKATRRPVALVCTSGTAAANWHPAIVEARYSQTPLIALSADRPPELRDTGANQTIDQRHLFASAPLWFFEMPVPAIEHDTERVWRSAGARAVATASGPPAGPVHLNLPLREPLVASGDVPDLGAGRDGGAPWERHSPAAMLPSPGEVDDLARVIDATDDGMIVCGALDADAQEIMDLSERAGWPLVAEPLSGLRHGIALSAPQLILDRIEPSVVLYTGAPPTSRATRALLDRTPRVLVVDAARWNDPDHRSSWTVRADAALLASALSAVVKPREDRTWMQRWHDADASARAAADALMDSWDEPFEGRIARDVAAAVPDGGVLAIGSSLPVRDLDSYMRPREDLWVIGNRGASGIDGFISTVLGIAQGGDPTVGLMGDLTFLHDAGSLAWLAPRAKPAVLVVEDNGGGAIFDLLPQGGVREADDLFVTPHAIPIEPLVRAAGCGYERVTRADAVVPAVAKAGDAGVTTIVHVACDRAAGPQRRAAIAAAVADALR